MPRNNHRGRIEIVERPREWTDRPLPVGGEHAAYIMRGGETSRLIRMASGALAIMTAQGAIRTVDQRKAMAALEAENEKAPPPR